MPFNVCVSSKDDLFRTIDDCNNDTGDNETNVDSMKIQLILKLSRRQINASKLIDDIKLIDKDLERTGYIIQLDSDKSVSDAVKMRLKETLRNILITFAAYNQNVSSRKQDDQSTNSLGYTQGMNEFVSIFVSVFSHESIAYWCFSNFMLHDIHSTSSLTLNTTRLDDGHALKTNMAHYFSDLGVKKKLFYLSDLLQKTDPELFAHLKRYELDNVCFCHEWLLLLFKRCFGTVNDYLKCFEMLNSHFVELHASALNAISIKEIYSFDLFICLALIRDMRDQMLQLNSDMDIYELVREFNRRGTFQMQFDKFIKLGEQIFEKHCIKSSDEQSIDISNESSSFRIQFKKFTDFVFN